MSSMQFSDVIDLWPNVPTLAADVGATPAQAHKWRQRNSIPAEYWHDLASASSRRKYGISINLLASIAKGAS